ncbi:MAG: YihY/virulence factor BrkB family protein [Flavobacteriaceae bacterium]|nr:YihY/virulence factor BrkB family protein [Flavobacteriaceae bacterium]
MEEEQVEIKKEKRIPIISWVFDLGKKIILPGLEGLSLHDVLEMYIRGIVKGALTTRASAISYSFFMSLFPFLLFVFNLLPYFEEIGLINYREDFLPFLESVFPPNTLDAFEETTQNIFKKKNGGLLSTSFILSMFLIANGVNALFNGFRNSIHTRLTRHFVKQYFVAFGVGLLLALFLFLTVIAIPLTEIYIVQNLKDFGHIDTDLGGIIVAKYVIFTVMFYTTIATFYYFGTPGKKSSRYFTPGANLSTILFLLTTYLFGIYVNNFAQYNELYGSIGAILILMLYIWLNSNILLLGFELNASLKILKIKNTQNNLNT